MKINVNKRQTNKYGEEMTELINQLAEEIEEMMPKYVYIVYRNDEFVLNIYKINKVYRTRKDAFKEVFGIEKEGELNKWYDIDIFKRMKVVRMNIE